MSKLSITIMAHPARAEHVQSIKDMLGEDVFVAWDRYNNVWDTCRRAWLGHDMNSEYAVVIQDDAIITSNFREKAEKILQGDYVYSFYSGEQLRPRIESAEQKGEDKVINGMIMNEVAICIPTKYIEEMVDFCDRKDADTDKEITIWAKNKRFKIWNTIPSLVDHKNLPSIFRKVYNYPPKEYERKAVRFEP